MKRLQHRYTSSDSTEAGLSSPPLPEALWMFLMRSGFSGGRDRAADAMTMDRCLKESTWSSPTVRHSLLRLRDADAGIVMVVTAPAVDDARHAGTRADQETGLPAGGRNVGVGKRRAELSDEDQVEADLRKARSLRELGDMQARRAVWAGHRQGLSQRRLGDLLGRSQPDVGRTIKRIEQDASLVEPSPREFALLRAVGMSSDDEMMAHLFTFEYSAGETDPSSLGSGYLPGSWDEIRTLRRDGLITDEEWDQLFHATFPAPAAGRPALVLPGSGA